MHNKDENIVNQLLPEYSNLLCQELFSVFLHDHGNMIDHTISKLEYFIRANEKLDTKRKNAIIKDIVTSLLSSKEILKTITELLYRRHTVGIVNIEKGISNVVDALKSISNRKGVNISLNINAGQLELNESHFSTLLFILILNAVESYSDNVRNYGEKKVKVTAKCINSECVIKVKDYGKGVDAILHEKIFEPGITTKPNGSGMGLLIAKRITEMYGGRITFQSSIGKGTEFSVILPIDLGLSEVR